VLHPRRTAPTFRKPVEPFCRIKSQLQRNPVPLRLRPAQLRRRIALSMPALLLLLRSRPVPLLKPAQPLQTLPSLRSALLSALLRPAQLWRRTALSMPALLPLLRSVLLLRPVPLLKPAQPLQTLPSLRSVLLSALLRPAQLRRRTALSMPALLPLLRSMLLLKPAQTVAGPRASVHKDFIKVSEKSLM
jgi:hypothetical protein